eukprot:g21177.t1
MATARGNFLRLWLGLVILAWIGDCYTILLALFMVLMLLPVIYVTILLFTDRQLLWHQVTQCFRRLERLEKVAAETTWPQWSSLWPQTPRDKRKCAFLLLSLLLLGSLHECFMMHEQLEAMAMEVNNRPLQWALGVAVGGSRRLRRWASPRPRSTHMRGTRHGAGDDLLTMQKAKILFCILARGSDSKDAWPKSPRGAAHFGNTRDDVARSLITALSPEENPSGDAAVVLIFENTRRTPSKNWWVLQPEFLEDLPVLTEYTVLRRCQELAEFAFAQESAGGDRAPPGAFLLQQQGLEATALHFLHSLGPLGGALVLLDETFPCLPVADRARAGATGPDEEPHRVVFLLGLREPLSAQQIDAFTGAAARASSRFMLCSTAIVGRRSHAFLRGLVAALLAWWLSVQAAQAFGYTGGSAKVQARSEGLRTTVGVREKFGSLARKRADGKKFKAAGGGKSRAASSGRKDDESEARILTSRIKEAPAAAELLGILDEAVEVPYFNHIHASAAYHSLATFHRKGTLHDCGESPQILRLHAKVEEVLSKKTVDARATANVFWALAVLIDAAPTIIQLLPTLVKAFRATARSMKAQELANCLWAFAQLKGIAPEVLSLVPTLIAQIPGKACDMKPQELSNSLWASAQLKDVAPDVLDIVPVLVEEIPSKASGMKPQELSNSLWASAHLKDVVPDVLNIVKELVEEIPDKAAEMIPQHLSNCLWASAHLKDVAPDVLNIVPALVEEIPHKAFAMKPQEMSNCLWASAQLKDATPDVLKILPALVEEIPSIATEMKPQELSNSLWASAHLQEVAPRVLNMVSALVAQIQRKVDLNPQQLSNCLWALARLKNVVPDDIVVALAGILPQILGKAVPRALEAAEVVQDELTVRATVERSKNRAAAAADHTTELAAGGGAIHLCPGLALPSQSTGSQTHVLLFGLELLGCHPITIRSLDLTIRAPTMCDTAPDVVAPAAAAALAAREKWELKPTEQLLVAQHRRELGNVEMRAQRPVEAFELYKKALFMVEFEEDFQEDSEEERELPDLQEATFDSNRSPFTVGIAPRSAALHRLRLEGGAHVPSAGCAALLPDSEHEILLPPNMEFRVKSVIDLGHGLTEVQCEQIEELDPLMDFSEALEPSLVGPIAPALLKATAQAAW